MTYKNQGQGATAYIGLGSNIDDREAYLRQAISALEAAAEVTVAAGSSLYETEPVGYVEQAPFLNMAVELRTHLAPHALLAVLADVERRLGRTRDIRWGPRTIDLDLLLYDEERLSTPDLIIPHPRMHERAFVLVPLVELLRKRNDSAFAFIYEYLEKLEGKEGVVLWKKVQ